MNALWTAIHAGIAGIPGVVAMLDETKGIRRARQPQKGDFGKIVTYWTGSPGNDPEKPGVGVFLTDVIIAAWVDEGQGEAADDLCAQIIWPIVYRFDKSVKHDGACALTSCSDHSLRIYKSRFDTFQGPAPNFDEELRCWRADAVFMITFSACAYSTPAVEP